MTVRALLVPEDDDRTVEVVELGDPLLQSVWAIVGGYIETVGDDTWHAYIHEDGKFQGKLANVRATKLARSLGFAFMPGDYIAGPALFFGPADDVGGETDVPEFVVDKAIDWGFLPEPEEKTKHGWRVDFDRVSRYRNVDPIIVTDAGDDPDEIAKAVFEHVRNLMVSRNINVVVDLDERKGTIFAGLHVGGSFKLHRIELGDTPTDD